MKKYLFMIFVAILAVVLLMSCGSSAEKEDSKECTHDYEKAETIKASCGTEGLNTYTCKKCGDVYTEKTEPNGIHRYSTRVTKEATCTEDGIKTFTCSVCSDSYTKPIKTIGAHDYEVISNTATCTKDGQKTFACSSCGDSYVEEQAAGHIWQAATCSDPETCQVCKETKGETTPHKYSGYTCIYCNGTNTSSWLNAGNYTAGNNIKTGVFYVSADGSDGVEFVFSGGNLYNERVTRANSVFVTLKHGDKFELIKGKIIDASNHKANVSLNNIPHGAYRVGVDIPAGKYIAEMENRTRYEILISENPYPYPNMYNSSGAYRTARGSGGYDFELKAGDYLEIYSGKVRIADNPADSKEWTEEAFKTFNSHAVKANDYAKTAYSYLASDDLSYVDCLLCTSQLADCTARLGKLKEFVSGKDALVIDESTGKTLLDLVTDLYNDANALSETEFTESNYKSQRVDLMLKMQTFLVYCEALTKM